MSERVGMLIGRMLGRLRELQRQPDWVSAQEREERAELLAIEQRLIADRRTRLRRERVPLSAEAEQAIALGTGLECDRVSAKSLYVAKTWLGRVNVPPVLALCGATGCGKSVAAAWVLAARGGRWRGASQLCRAVAAHYGPAAEDLETALGALVLVVDDLGSEREPELMGSALLEILDRRQHERYRTVLTTNLSRSEALARYSNPRLVSRLGDDRLVAWVTDSGPDRRRKGPP